MRKKKKKKLKKLIEPYVSYSWGSDTKVEELSSLERWQLKRNFQKNKGNFVSDFTSWIYESTKGQKDNQNTRSGAANEEKIYDKYIYEEPVKSLSHFKKRFYFNDDWVIESDDLRNKKSSALRISSLKIDGEALYGKPDIVLKNIKTNDRMIIEVKSTKVPEWKLISDKYKWLNIQCQLWAYSFIDKFKDSPNLYLIGVIWIKDRGKLKQHREPLYWRFRKNGEINLKKKRLRIFHEKCKDIFENIYGGEII